MALVADGVSCWYPAGAPRPAGALVLDRVSLAVEPGRIVGLTGPSGAGKSSLGRILCGLQPAQEGAVLVDGEPVPTRRGRMTGVVGLLHQSPRAATSPRLTLGAIVAEPLPRRERGASAGRARVAGAARRVGLTPDLLGRLPAQVSDGQLQRACLARALLAAPRYLVADEPTAMLDAATTAAAAQVLRELAAAGAGVLLVSHDHPLVDALADERVLLPGDVAR
ncbi:ATP-binding cassette domain-containing protein [Isoptericola sp. NPDC056605]|uniref:ATP-binding cassette domain-containing protein n=1 Tax=Isoptericola sp. NPDC056605 TaxID=3345876 RepID=UPI00369C1195